MYVEGSFDTDIHVLESLHLKGYNVVATSSI